MASPGSFIRSAARATSSAYRRLPIRWRLAGGSALLTLVILLGFAAIVGVLTTRQIESDFNREVADAADELQRDGASRGSCRRGRRFQRYDFRARPRAARTSTPTRRARTPSSGSSTSDGTVHQRRRRTRRTCCRRATRHAGVRRLPDRVAPDPAVRLRRDLRPVRAPAVRRARRRRTACGCSSGSACSAAPRSRCWPAWPPRRARWRRSRGSPTPRARSRARATRR